MDDKDTNVPNKNDFISQDTAMSMPLANERYDHEHANEHFIFGLETYREWLEQIPAADVVEVVRCKDCKWYLGSTKICYHQIGTGLYTANDDFCSKGERRADNGN